MAQCSIWENGQQCREEAIYWITCRRHSPPMLHWPVPPPAHEDPPSSPPPSSGSGLSIKNAIDVANGLIKLGHEIWPYLQHVADHFPHIAFFMSAFFVQIQELSQQLRVLPADPALLTEAEEAILRLRIATVLNGYAGLLANSAAGITGSMEQFEYVGFPAEQLSLPSEIVGHIARLKGRQSQPDSKEAKGD